MATDKKHIAVYLDPAVEAALVEFCEQKGLVSKKGTMYSAGVNAVLAVFFRIADIDNILQSSSTIPSPTVSNIPSDVTSNTPAESIDVEALPGKSESLSEGETDSLRQELEALRAENQRWEEAFNVLEGERDDHAIDLDIAFKQLKSLKVEGQRLQDELGNSQAELMEVRSQLETLKTENEALRTAQPVTETELPEASDLLNQLKAKRKKSNATLTDIKKILEILEGR
jgi:predicted nuclease with TOPRIM domain